MQKANMTLSAITLLMITGGIFAFRTQRFGSASYYTCDRSNNICDKPVSSIYASFSTLASPAFPYSIPNAAISRIHQPCTLTQNCGTIFGSIEQ